MKIKLEFEKDDFHAMLETYFSETGWEVLNLPDVVDQFETAFPGGIVVEAIPNAVPRAQTLQPPARRAASPVTDAADDGDDYAAADDGYEAEEVDDEDNPTLGMGDLMGPSDEDIDAILKQSERLK